MAVNAKNRHQARENVGNRVPLTYWLRAQWREFSAPITKSRKARDNQFKIALQDQSFALHGFLVKLNSVFKEIHSSVAFVQDGNSS